MADEPRDRWVTDSVARYERPLIAYATRLTGDGEIARDVVQDAFLRLCTQPEAVRGHLAEWLFTVCRHRALDHLRRPRKEHPMPIAFDHSAVDTPAPSAGIEQAERSARLLDVLAALPTNQQEVIRLKFQHGLSYQEISRITDLSAGNVGFPIHVGIKRLRATLATDPAIA